MTTHRLRWGILGSGSIARTFADALKHSHSGELVAVGTRNPARPELKDWFPAAIVVDGYQSLLNRPDVDAVYIATPHPSHPEWAIKAARAGKHVLVEKPMGINAAQATTMMHEARQAGTFLGEAFMYRSHPQTQKLIELVASGVIGEVRLVKSSFGFALPEFMPEHRLYANDLGGGGILDVGCYPASIARLIAGASIGEPFLDPISVQGVAHLGATGVDEWASAVMKFPTGMLAEVSASVSLNQDNVLRIFGTGGRIEVSDFWFASGLAGGIGAINFFRDGHSPEVVEVHESGWLYAFEADAVGAAVANGKTQFAAPAMTWADTLGNMKALDAWRATAGLTYDMETVSGPNFTITGDTLGPLGNHIPHRSLPGLQKPVSTLALGCAFLTDFSSASILMDHFWEAGGNLFDTSWHYGSGFTDGLLGQWINSRGVRDQAVVVAKGAHTPLCLPDMIGVQLSSSLAAMQSDFVDVYVMHRDNPAVPVGEFVDAINAEIEAGRIRGPFGGSNWSMERMDEAIVYAQRVGKIGPTILSNNFSLADMIRPVWDGCEAASSPEWKAWLTRSGVTNLAWSSQARGFFTVRAGRELLGDSELVSAWYSEGNFARRDRAIEVGEAHGVSQIHIALAYVLGQKFSSIPIIGPANVPELDDSLAALGVQLTDAEIEFLETGAR